MKLFVVILLLLGSIALAQVQPASIPGAITRAASTSDWFNGSFVNRHQNTLQPVQGVVFTPLDRIAVCGDTFRGVLIYSGYDNALCMCNASNTWINILTQAMCGIPTDPLPTPMAVLPTPLPEVMMLPAPRIMGSRQ